VYRFAIDHRGEPDGLSVVRSCRVVAHIMYA